MDTNTLYNDLIELTKNNDAFYFTDRVVSGKTYRVFNYRLTSWSEMQKPNAKNCRGTTFLLDGICAPHLVSLPPEKFFNYEEGDIDHTPHKIACVMNKLDGSLISTVSVVMGFILKSKSSFDSEQALAATAWLLDEANANFFATVADLESIGYTVNMEWTSPENRIVVPYQESKLTILNVRSYLDTVDGDMGVTYYGDSLRKLMEKYGVEYKESDIVVYDSIVSSNHGIIADMKNETEGEGYVVEIQHPDGSYLVKVKNHKYLTLHKTKDSVNVPSKLFEAIIMETADDLRGMFGDDQFSLIKIDEMEQRVIPVYNKIISNVEKFYEINKHLSRKEYAIKAQNMPELVPMPLTMNLYLGRTNDYQAFALKHAELFDISGDGESKLNLSWLVNE